MKHSPKFFTWFLTIFHFVYSKAVTRSPSLLYCFKYIGQFIKGGELEIAICIGSQGSATLFQRSREDYRNSN